MVFSKEGFGIDIKGASAILPTREEMFAYIDNFVQYKLEQVYLPLTGNMFGLIVDGSTVASTFSPIEKMKTELLRGFDREDEERHLLAFLHEFHTTLNTEIAAYKASEPRFLRSNQKQVYSEGKRLMAPDREKDYLETLNQVLAPLEITLTYATGPIGEHFQDFIQRCYRRATKMLELSEQFDGTQYETFSIEEFRHMAEVLTGEKQGLQVENTAPYSFTVTLNGKAYTLTRDKNSVPLHYDNLSSVTLSGGSSSSKDDAAVMINSGEKAFIANIGRGGSKTRKVVLRGIKDEHDVIHPNTTRFSGSEVYKRITFEELPKPIARTRAPINLRRNAETRLDFPALFDVPSVGRIRYSPSILSGDAVISLRNQTDEDFATIIAKGNTGTAEIVVTGENEAGPTDVIVTVHVR